MPPQAEWKALENKYATPPTYEDTRMRARRASNWERARSRLQQRPIARAVRVQSEAAQSAGVSSPPRVKLTQIERVVISRRFASPELCEDPDRRQRRQAALLRAERRLEGRAAARRLQLPEAVPDDILTSIHDVNRPTVREPGSRPVTSASVWKTTLPSHEQLAAAIINLSSEVLAYRADDEGFPSYDQLGAALRNLSPATTLSEHGPDGYPTYEQLTSALRNLTPDVPTQDEPSPGFPSYAQLNAALPNLSPEQLSQDQHSPGFPTYEQLAQALRNLSVYPSHGRFEQRLPRLRAISSSPT
ncbi:hypothetical protein PC129_g19839 [Phytophthora cactorum]|uniref:Uncharacterized protein n=1 Tax=Phytophthora cactorum TaxID=29920 RepID=A0A8T0YRB5_9STRA|nr:hypothetical protein Pcac1_g14203 [Phytophthora cactorum]KAG2808510.1 hypothetical protein PC111_g16453 [Phytophthora cactorum]KAG2812092.1 hypothetical protein PC112_g15323 [Phytophthora cactorum]KAG2853020.1 hypothetical protein PC113_g14525 [Phytophthora cactorum]KAG2878827.1 hypothetical protein PC114_g22881 [Phytophthora cactorum]